MITRRAALAGASALSLSWPLRGAPGPAPAITDTHVHLFGPPDRYPLVAERPYIPAPASIADLLAFNREHGIDRSILVQPSFYGTDNSLLIDALRALGARAAGVAVIAPDVADSVLQTYKAARVRGVRLNLESGGAADPAAAARLFDALVARLGGTGLHLQLFARLSILDALADRLAACPVPLVIDHFGFPPAGTAANDPAFRRLVGLAGSGRAYVKLSAPWRIGGVAPSFEGLRPLALALVDAAPQQMLWGSDWPHTRRVEVPTPDVVVPFAAPEVAAWIAALSGWLGPERWKQTRTDNAERLYFDTP